MGKSLTVGKIKKKAWKIFSEYIRLRDCKKSTDTKLVTWAKDVKERDGFLCQRCKDEQDTPLCAHHKASKGTRPDLKYKLENGITLGFRCHRRVHDHPKLAKEQGYINDEKYELHI